MLDRGLVHGDLHLQNVALKDLASVPLVQLLDFGRSANAAAVRAGQVGALRAGHEYDVFRLIREICNSYEELHDATTEGLKNCEKEVRELRRMRDVVAGDAKAEGHHSRQIAGLQAYLQDEPMALEQVEVAYNAVLASVTQYACLKLDLVFDGLAFVRNRKMKQAASKREKSVYAGYFKSDLFWDGCEV